MPEDFFRFAPGRFGRTDIEPGVRVIEWTDCALAHVVARSNRAQAAREAVRDRHGVELPATPFAAVGPDATFLWNGPDQWLVLMPAAVGEVEERLAPVFAGSASVFDQTDGRVLLEVDGDRARDALAKGCSLDLDPRAFAPGRVAATAIAHLNVHLWHVAATGGYRMLVVRTYFDSFWRWLAASAAEYGAVVDAPRPWVHEVPERSATSPHV